MAIWLPGYERVNLGLSGKPFEYTHNPKGLLHSTEGTSLAGAESAMRAYPSHVGYDYKTREKHQYISLDLAAYSAMDESDNDPIYQVELVGFAKDMRFLPDWALRNISEDVVKPLADTIGIPPTIIWHGFKDGLDGIYPYLASPESPIRLSYSQLRAFSGWLGHQHLPSPDSHWDPGAINMARLIELAYGDGGMSAQEAYEGTAKLIGDMHHGGAGATGKELAELVLNYKFNTEGDGSWAPYETTVGTEMRYNAFNFKRVFDALEDLQSKINRPAPVALTPEDRAAIVAALATAIPAAVVAEFKKEGN